MGPIKSASFERLVICCTDGMLGTPETMAGGPREQPVGSRLTEADELFAALDGQIVSDDDQQWEIRVWGIHADSGRLWLQIGFLARKPFESVSGTVAVAPGRARDAVRDFLSWRRSIHRTELFRTLTTLA